jgi:ABC-2 type transport system ATP-binding protein
VASNSSPVPAVDAVGVVKRYGRLVAVNGISVEVGQGEVYGILGPNGAGKTTFMRMLFGLIRPDAGEIRLFGRSWKNDGTRALDNVGGFVETPRFYPYLTGRENLRGLARLDGNVVKGRVEEVLDLVELADRADDRVREYSYGMVQRLGVAASLLRDPRLLVVDEPANGLDPAGIRAMRALIKRLGESGLTVLLSSHDMAEVEEICDNVTIMHRGNVVFHGSISDLRDRAPEQGHRLSTDDDVRAIEVGRRTTKLRIGPAETGGLSVVGPQDDVDRYVRSLVAEGLVLRSLEYTETPLKTLFFMLTESGDGTEPAGAEVEAAA